MDEFDGLEDELDDDKEEEPQEPLWHDYNEDEEDEGWSPDQLSEDDD